MTSRPLRERFAFLCAHPAHFIACGFGSGLSPVAPGTLGTLFAWGSFILFRPLFTDDILLGVLVAAFILGIAAVHKTGKDLGVVDDGSIVWDEIVPFWFVLFFCPPDLSSQAMAFLLFRIFDILKPQPARYFDEKVKNGLGVMCDDLIAALYTLMVVIPLRSSFP